MGHRIVKMPSGKFAIFSTIVDDFVVYDATPKQLIDYYVEKETVDIIERIMAITDALTEGRDPRPCQYRRVGVPENWAEIVAWIEEVHGESKWCATCGKLRAEGCDCDG